MNKTAASLSLILNIILIVVSIILLTNTKDNRSSKVQAEAKSSSHNKYVDEQTEDSVIIVMYGNSITYGGKWQQVLQRTDVANWGIPGYTTGQLIWTIKDFTKKYTSAKICFISGGTNDISLGIPVERIIANQKLAIDSISRCGIIPVLQSTLYQTKNNVDFNKKAMALNKALSEYCNKNNIAYIDVNPVLTRNNVLIDELSVDGCHLTPEAYPRWAKLVTRELKKQGI